MLARSNRPRTSTAYYLTTAAYLAQRGVPPKEIQRWASQFGRLAKRRFMADNEGREPKQLPRMINGTSRRVYAYRDVDVPMLDDVWQAFEAGLRKRGLLG